MKNFYNNRHKEIVKIINHIDTKKLIKLEKLILNTHKLRGKIIVCGNGGSAAIASHFSVDLTKNAKVRCFNFNESDLITCFSNDYGYEKWVEKAVSFYGDEGDVLIVISASGKSKNMIYGCQAARKKSFSNIITFTGSAETGKMLKAHPRLLEEAVKFNMEADSLNCSVLGEDSVPGTAEFDIFIKEVHKEMIIKAGQKCTAVRRIIVPEKLVEDVQIALSKRLSKTIIGNPSVEGVRMGSLAGNEQKIEVTEKVQKFIDFQ